MEHDIPFGNSNRENGPTFLDFPLFLGIFQWDEPTKRVPFTADPEIPEILTKWKAPYSNGVRIGREGRGILSFFLLSAFLSSALHFATLSTMTLKMTTARVVETSVTVNNNSLIQDYVKLNLFLK